MVYIGGWNMACTHVNKHDVFSVAFLVYGVTHDIYRE